MGAGLWIEARVASDAWRDMPGSAEAVLARALEAAARHLDAGGEAAVLLTDDAHMQALNARWRGLDKPTDVLSFPADGPGEPDGARFLGDIAIGWETSARDARQLGRSMEAHLSHLAVHGFLHLLGYDHVVEADADRMEALERDILAGLGFSDPYAIDPKET